jgi:hypothetical protein
MPAKPMLLRTFLLLSFLPAVLIVLHARQERSEERASAKDFTERYDKIVVFMPASEIDEILGGEGVEVAGPGWPQVLGDLPGYETGFRGTIAARGPAFVLAIADAARAPAQLQDVPDVQLPWEIEKGRKIWWKKWQYPSVRDRWIAVAFMWWDEGGILSVPRVIAKKKHSPPLTFRFPRHGV